MINTGFSEEDREQRESDVNKLVRKISIYIKNKLTDADIESLDTVFASLDKTASIVTAKIMSELDRYMELPNSPDDTDKKPNKLDVEKSEEDGEEPKKEALHDNFYKRKLKKKIREMIRTAILQKKLRK